jgi:hypothetical protein
MKNFDFAVLVLSCDKYADLWKPFFRQFKRYFRIDDYKVYLGSNTLRCSEIGVVSVLSGEDEDWSSSFRKILEQIPESRLFVILEDLFLTSPVDIVKFNTGLGCIMEKGTLHVKCWAIPVPLQSTSSSLLGVYPKGAPYRVTVCGFWNRDYLLRLLVDGEDPWNFEILGSYRSSYSEGFYGLTSPLFEYRNMIEKGKWIPESLAWARDENIELLLHYRSVLAGGNRLLSLIKMLYFDLLQRIPWHWRVTLMNIFRRALGTY